MSPAESRHPETTCARPPREPASITRPLAPSLHASVVYEVASLEDVDALYNSAQPGFLYARDAHPNLVQLCGKLSAIEGAEAAWAGASGMAVEAMPLLSLLRSGDGVAIAHGVYGKTAKLVEELGRFGLTLSRFDPTQPLSLDAAITPRTRFAIAETLSNPLLRVADIAGLAQVAQSHNCLLLIDHTFAPLLCKPLALGADLVAHSATKFLGGHSDLTLGLIAGRATLIEQLGRTASIFGFTANPYECWMCLRGMATLGLRIARASQTALELAARLEGHRAVERVHYPGLASHADHALARGQLCGGFGAMMTIDVGGRHQADRFIQSLRGRIPFAPSLGDVATTLSHPATTSHRCLPPEDCQRQGIHAGLIRLSIGLENVDDLWSELDSAAAAAAAQGGS